ncbi:histidine--tRNA ligase [Serinibacter salmoneus]|uniref:Histidine--tRNA ligase n=1 Tax=Serinibacter salmoneus TaxID=556530 RepID=A0A2A9CYV4_9MICO|nr:histidine--tRNA ligase [Serinibacter salmoneus]PFG19618.1 histidyl-tRNA synthetase [Serinibacter salmoneus]
MARIAPLSGFPEWLPEQRIVEQRVLERIAHTFELHGFASVHTRAVEPLERLLSKGETSKEVYVLDRLQATEGEAAADQKDRLGLHFDLTVPFARYVLENAGKLTFPFKRYQIQPVWRGERPQEGRFREFWQADIDVVGDGELPFHLEVDVALVAGRALAALAEFGLPEVRILVNNRRLAEGFYRTIGLGDVAETLRIVDKLAKIGADGVAAALRERLGASEAAIQACLALAELRGGVEVLEQVRALAQRARADEPATGDEDAAQALLEQGLGELGSLLRECERRAPGLVQADLSVARGLDYYTGSVYETVLVGHEGLGSICSGGRYDALASDGGRTFPGVGISIGVSRVLSRLFAQDLVSVSRSVPTAVLVAVTDEAGRAHSTAVADALRARGIPADVTPNAAKFGKQIRYADRRGIPFVWFPGDSTTEAGDLIGQVKDIRSGEQVDADATTWEPPAADRWPSVSAASAG